jgi:hypothetical protein
LCLIEVLCSNETVACRFMGYEKLVELDVHRRAVLVLRLLNQEHHQEGDDRGASVDCQQPRLGKVE